MAGDGHEGDLRIFVVGSTGSGKSATCNTIVGQKLFTTGIFSRSTTRELQSARAVVAGQHVTVVDTPGLFDTSLDEEEVIPQVRSLVVTHPGPHALLYVVRGCARYTSEEFHAYVGLKKLFGESITNHIIVALIQGDLLEEENITLDDFMREARGELNSVLKECGRRCIIFNNKRPGNEARELVNMIQSLGRGHFDQGPYSEATRATVDEEIERRLRDAYQEELKKSCSVKALHQLRIEAEQEARKMNDELAEVKKEVAAARTTRLRAAITGSVVGGVAAATVLNTSPSALLAGFALGGSIGHLVGEALSKTPLGRSLSLSM